MSEKKKIKLVLEDGTEVEGLSFGADVSAAGEVVFNTAMTGYPESLTDPSYKGEILILTYPIIGNYGVPVRDKEDHLFKYFESNSLHISALVISDYTEEYSHWNAERSLGDWLKEHNIPGICNVDTRMLTKIIREKGSMPGKIISNGEDIDFYDPNTDNLVAQVSCKKREVYGNGKYKIVLVDCGVKNSMLRYLMENEFTIIRVPWDYDFLQEDYDGLFISNGPGDPKKCDVTIRNISKAMEQDKPIFGICLGNQLMGLASGADTYKLKYGHRSHNQPVIHAGTNRAYITSQNHGYAINNNTLAKNWDTLFLNLNDNTNEGIIHKTKPFFSTQFHPEASGGPTDTIFLFEKFHEMVKTYHEKGIIESINL